MKILLLGHNGYLGSYIQNWLDCDTLNKKNIYNNGKKYNYIINCIGKPDVLFCEKNPDISKYSNCDIILDIQKYYPTAKIINFSSYYVYNDNRLCKEVNSKTCTEYNYMVHKLKSEILNTNGVNLRIGKLFGNKNKKQKKFFDHIIDNNYIECDETLFNPCSCKTVRDVIEFELKNKNLFGTYNCANTGSATHYEFASFLSCFLPEKTIKKVKYTNHLTNYGNFFMDLSKLNSIIDLRHWAIDLHHFFNL